VRWRFAQLFAGVHVTGKVLLLGGRVCNHRVTRVVWGWKRLAAAAGDAGRRAGPSAAPGQSLGSKGRAVGAQGRKVGVPGVRELGQCYYELRYGRPLDRCNAHNGAGRGPTGRPGAWGGYYAQLGGREKPLSLQKGHLCDVDEGCNGASGQWDYMQASEASGTEPEGGIDRAAGRQSALDVGSR
jgi:hypothetical protein